MPVDRNHPARLRVKMWDTGSQLYASRLNVFRYIIWKQPYLCEIHILNHKASISDVAGLKLYLMLFKVNKSYHMSHLITNTSI